MFTEIKETVSTLAELSKGYETLSNRELNKSLGERSMGMIPRNGGEWSGEPGNSTWVPDREVSPSDRNYSNTEGKTWGEIFLKKFTILLMKVRSDILKTPFSSFLTTVRNVIFWKSIEKMSHNRLFFLLCSIPLSSFKSVWKAGIPSVFLVTSAHWKKRPFSRNA